MINNKLLEWKPLKYDKKADIIYPVIIFIVLNVMFFGILLAFVFKSSTGALIYEQAYSKQIALFIDMAKPPMEISMNFDKGFEIAENNKMQKEDLVVLKDNEVIVKLSNGGGYSFRYFSDYDVTSYFDNKNLIITINENEK